MEKTYFSWLFLSWLMIQTRAAPAEEVNKLRAVDWFWSGQEGLNKYNNVEKGVAKNVILFVGDGMGLSTVTAARILKSQTDRTSLHDTHLAWETFPHTAISKTYNVDQLTPDSAGTATAFLTGYKTNHGVMGVNQNVIHGNCDTIKGNEIQSIFHHGHRDGKWTGIVTTTRVTQATPAAAYATTANRMWETKTEKVPAACKDIASQLVEDNHFIRVVMGGGRQMFTPINESDPEYPDRLGLRQDGRNLIQEWESTQISKPGIRSDRVHSITNKTQFENLDEKNVEFVLGLFEASHMQFELDREDPEVEKWGEPSLVEMTEKAINILSSHEEGYILLVEGGRIDHGHHRNMAYKALTETLALSEAVERAVKMTNEEDTLLIVTADHSHVFHLSGYPSPVKDILGLTYKAKEGTRDEVVLHYAKDGLPMLPLSYINGPGFYKHRGNSTHNHGRRLNLTEAGASGLTKDKNYMQDAAIPLRFETHAGEDVVVYSRGPMSHLLNGVHEQTFIAHVMMYASCVGPNKAHCSSAARQTNDGATLRQQWARIATLFTTVVTTFAMTLRSLVPS